MPRSHFKGFFFDNNMSPRFAKAMKALGEHVEHMSDLWPQGDPGDMVWLPEIAKRGLTLVTWDKGLYRKPHELALFREHKAGGFLLAAKRGASHCDQIEQLVRQWRALKQTAQSTERPFLLRLRPRGRVFTPVLKLRQRRSTRKRQQ